MSDARRLVSPTAATLLRSADRLEIRGWCQRPIGLSQDGPICPGQAIFEVADPATAVAAYEYFSAYVSRRFRDGGIARWNDSRTKAEVIAALRAAAMEEMTRASKGAER